jgi:hypothetical protein
MTSITFATSRLQEDSNSRKKQISFFPSTITSNLNVNMIAFRYTSVHVSLSNILETTEQVGM